MISKFVHHNSLFVCLLFYIPRVSLHTCSKYRCVACLIACRHWFIAHGNIHHTVAMDNIIVFVAGIICWYVQCRSRLAVHVCIIFCRCKVKLDLAARNFYATCLINVKNVALRLSMAMVVRSYCFAWRWA